MKNIALIFGGKSVEHDISVITALQTMQGIGDEFKVLPVYLTADGKLMTSKNLDDENIYLDFSQKVDKVYDVVFPAGLSQAWIMRNGKVKHRIKIDCALLCCHGNGGEDGSLQGLLEIADIAYTSSAPLSSALCMNKVATKKYLTNADILTPKYVHFHLCEYDNGRAYVVAKIEEEIGYPCIVKPANLGSSVGINICENEKELRCAIDDALIFDKNIIVEKFVEKAREFCCAVIKSGENVIASNVTEVKKDKIFTFEEKYLSEKENGKRQISKSLDEKIKKSAKLAYNALDCHGVVRVDFLYDGKKLYVNELNSIPGSLSFSMFDLPHSDLLKALIDEGIKRKENKSDITYKFNSQAIQKFIEMKKNLKTNK